MITFLGVSFVCAILAVYMLARGATSRKQDGLFMRTTWTVIAWVVAACSWAAAYGMVLCLEARP